MDFSRLLITTVYNVLFALIFEINGTDLMPNRKYYRRSALIEQLELNAQDWFIDYGNN